MITKEQFIHIQNCKNNQTITEIAKYLNLDRSTVRKYSIFSRYPESISYNLNTIPTDKIKYYAYLLGLYLGDGYINKTERTYRLRLALNSVHHLDVIERAKKRLGMIFPNNKIGIVNVTGSNCINLSVYSSSLVNLFPQHGVSFKHTRSINITDEQEKIIHEYKDYLLCGLHDSDGCKYTDRGNEYYQFTNISNDIISIYLNCLSKNDIKYRLYPKNVRVRRKEDVEKIASILQTCYSEL